MNTLVILASLVLFQFSGTAWSQQTVVPLRDEPRHVPKFENEFVRVIDMILLPGDSSLLHEHKDETVTIVLEGADITNQLLSGEPTRARPQRGRVAYNNYTKQPYTHLFSNVGSTPFRVIGVELLVAPRVDPLPSPPRDAPYEVVLENVRVRVWRLVLEPGQSAATNPQALSGVRVVQEGGKARQRVQDKPDQIIDLQRGDFHWQSGGIGRSLENVGGSRIELIEVELR